MRLMLLLIGIVFLAGCADSGTLETFKPGQRGQYVHNFGSPHEKIAFLPPRKMSWRREKEEKLPDGTLTALYIPQTDTPDTWQQSFTATFLPGKLYPGQNKQLLKELELSTKQTCPNSIFKVLYSGKGATTFINNGYNCSREGDRVTAGKIMLGDDGLYLMQYTAVSSQVRERAVQFGLHTVISARLTR